jgi:hypothetical protein
MSRVTIVVLLLLNVHASWAADATLVELGGRTAGVTLRAIDADWRCTFEVGEELRSIGPEELVRWGEFRDQSLEAETILLDGSTIVGDLLAIESELIRVVHETLGVLELPRSVVQGIVCAPAGDPLSRDRVRADLAPLDSAESRRDSDRVFLRNGDVIGGSVTSVAGEEANLFGFETLQVRSPRSDREVTLPLAATTAIGLAQADTRLDDSPRLMLGLRDGTLIAVERIDIRGDWLNVTTLCGYPLRAHAASLWSNVRFVQPLGRGVQYLGKESAEDYKHIPFLAAKLPWHADQNVLGGRLRVRGAIALKGVGMHPASRLTFAVPRDAQRFQSDVALDDHSGHGGSVIFRVFLARPDETGRERWEPAYASSVVRGNTPPRAASIDVSAATRLALIVEFADRGDELDYANWLEARFVF